MFNLLLGLVAAGAFDQEIVLGRDDAWRDLAESENLIRKTGMWGSLDLFVQENEYASGPETDLLLHFNELPLLDAAGRYRILQNKLVLSGRVQALGEASGGFTGDRQGVELRPQSGALFARDTRWGDFTIEFWLFPSLLTNGEEVLSWIGARRQGERSSAQEIRCAVRNRSLRWDLVNFFVAPVGSRSPASFSLQGITPLLPRVWHHHLVHFDSATGLLEYLVDGIPEAMAYARAERGAVLNPYTGEADSAPVILGRGFTGFMDELRISRSYIETPALSRYGDLAASAVSRPFDLGYTGTQLKRIDAVYRAEGDSGIFFYYKISNRLTSEQVEGPWRQFLPGSSLGDVRGRFLQVRVELFPDGFRRLSPQLSELRIVYEQDLPPAPPSGVQAIAGNGQVRLLWNSVREDDVRGYLVYYGHAPGSYRGTDSPRGASPIDVGPASELTLTGLENGRLYYFAVAVYDAAEPPHRSQLSKEVSARPSGALP